jgi:hypothetical protein
VGGVLVVTAAVVVDVGVFATFPAETTGGVDEPNRDGMDIDDSEEVEETGDGIAVTLVVAADTEVAFVLVVGANKFDIVGECFLFDVVVLIPVAFAAAVTPLTPLGEVAAGDDAIVCFAFDDDNDVVDVLVLVEGTLLLFTVVDAPEDGVFPFGMAVAVVDVAPAA